MNEKKIHEHRQSSRCLVYGTRCPDEQAEAAVDATLTKYIRSLVPPERLLVVNMTAGLEWSPLARFLQRPLPTGAFPRSDDFFCDLRPKQRRESVAAN